MLSFRRVIAPCVFVLIVIIESAHARALQDGPVEPCQVLPANITVSESLEPIVTALLRGSETFRRQCGAIARRPDVRVHVRLTATMTTWLTRASATISRFEAGALRAVIDLPVTRDTAELLGHEFEHVLEQVDGVNLRDLASGGGGAAHRMSDDSFETRRAVLAGLTVAEELSVYTASHRRATAALAPAALLVPPAPYRSPIR